MSSLLQKIILIVLAVTSLLQLSYAKTIEQLKEYHSNKATWLNLIYRPGIHDYSMISLIPHDKNYLGRCSWQHEHYPWVASRYTSGWTEAPSLELYDYCRTIAKTLNVVIHTVYSYYNAQTYVGYNEDGGFMRVTPLVKTQLIENSLCRVDDPHCEVGGRLFQDMSKAHIEKALTYASELKYLPGYISPYGVYMGNARRG